MAGKDEQAAAPFPKSGIKSCQGHIYRPYVHLYCLGLDPVQLEFERCKKYLWNLKNFWECELKWFV